MNNRMNIPSGTAGILLIAVAVAPVLVKKCKPAIKVIGESLVKAGQVMQKVASQA